MDREFGTCIFGMLNAQISRTISGPGICCVSVLWDVGRGMGDWGMGDRGRWDRGGQPTAYSLQGARGEYLLSPIILSYDPIKVSYYS